MGMIGGGQGAFIGQIHRIAARIDGQVELVCGAFSSDAARSKASGRELGLAESRAYGSYGEMLRAELKLPEHERMEFVAIVTPNHLHFPAAKAALEAGFHVLSDKPATLDLAEAKELAEVVAKTGLLYGLTHNYTGYPMVKEARDLVRRGEIGKVRKVVVEYPQGWLARPIEDANKQAQWRTDPARSGAAGCMGDIGTHAENLAEYVSGLKIAELAADLTSFVEGRTLDDDGSVLLRFEGGARGILHASQICVGEENNLKLRVYGETGGLEWQQQEPNTLLVHREGEPTRIYRAGQGYLCAAARDAARTPAGHPEGYLEAFANIYRAFAGHVLARANGLADSVHGKAKCGAEEGRSQQGAGGCASAFDYPRIEDGVRGMAFIEAVVRSSQNNASWEKLES